MQDAFEKLRGSQPGAGQGPEGGFCIHTPVLSTFVFLFTFFLSPPFLPGGGGGYNLPDPPRVLLCRRHESFLAPPRPRAQESVEEALGKRPQGTTWNDGRDNYSICIYVYVYLYVILIRSSATDMAALVIP